MKTQSKNSKTDSTSSNQKAEISLPEKMKLTLPNILFLSKITADVMEQLKDSDKEFPDEFYKFVESISEKLDFIILKLNPDEGTN